MIKTKALLTGEHLPGIAEKALPWSRAIRSIARFGACDIATVALIAALVVIVLCTSCGQKIRTVYEPVGRSASASLPGG